MFGKPKAKITHNHSSSVSMKKKAPPRPPPPAKSTIIARSASTGFESWKSKVTKVQRNESCSYNITNRSDLIDLSSPTNSPPKTNSMFLENFPGATSNEVPDFKYNIGASIFYVKSELKTSTGTTSTPAANPFSPPRPTPQSLQTKVKVMPVTVVTTTKITKQPTIIKGNTQATEALNNNNYGSSSQTKYTSVPLEWDEPPKKTYVPPPTVIRPIPPPKKPGLSSYRNTERTSVSTRPPSFIPPPVVNSQPRYDEPPEGSDDEFDDSFELNRAPEPAEPPPPPPEDLNLYAAITSDEQHWQSQSNFRDYTSDAADRAYGIAVYDYVSSESGDLQFSVGDVIYLTRRVDESWLYGTCGSAEGMFPSNFVEVVVPLSEGQGTYSESNSSNEIQSAFSSSDIYTESTSYPTHYVQALHDFEATEPNDLNIRMYQIVTVIGQVNEDWLYGELHGQKGQFPASFIEYIPANLPFIVPKAQ